MPPINPIRKFTVTIVELYAICRICWNSCLENIALFTAIRAIYDAPFVAAALAEVDAAEDMPGEDVRSEISEALRKDLVVIGETCRSKWRTLRAHITNSFEEQYVNGKLDAAGRGHYDAAYHENWDELQGLMNDGQNFITNNMATLTTVGGMPIIFSAEYDAAFTAFEAKYTAYKDAEQDAHAGMIAKLNANNALYEKVQAMNEYGQIIFENDPAKYNRFVFSRVKELVTPSTTPPIAVIENDILPNATNNEGHLPAAAKRGKFTLIVGGPVEIGASLDGTTFSGPTDTLNEPGSFSSNINTDHPENVFLLVKNLSGTLTGKYKVEIFA